MPDDKTITSVDIIREYNVVSHVALQWLRNKEKEGFLDSKKVPEKAVEFFFTQKAILFSSLLSYWKIDYEILLQEYPEMKPLQILERLKVKNKKFDLTTREY